MVGGWWLVGAREKSWCCYAGAVMLGNGAYPYRYGTPSIRHW